MKTVLFICTGNYYRSRFAEDVFNHHAKLNRLNWRADSAGLMVHETRHQNPGSISHYVLSALEELSIEPETHRRNPQPVTVALLDKADLIIATSETEHRSMVEERIPKYLSAITYWNVEDIEFEDPKVALKALSKLTLELIDNLKEN
jgi:protein-tyrosine phosphatase